MTNKSVYLFFANSGSKAMRSAAHMAMNETKDCIDMLLQTADVLDILLLHM